MKRNFETITSTPNKKSRHRYETNEHVDIDIDLQNLNDTEPEKINSIESNDKLMIKLNELYLMIQRISFLIEKFQCDLSEQKNKSERFSSNITESISEIKYTLDRYAMLSSRSNDEYNGNRFNERFNEKPNERFMDYIN